MSKEGSLRRIAIYKEHGNQEALKKEQEFYDTTFGSSPIVEEVPKEEKPKKVKKVEKIKKSD